LCRGMGLQLRVLRARAFTLFSVELERGCSHPAARCARLPPHRPTATWPRSRFRCDRAATAVPCRPRTLHLEACPRVEFAMALWRATLCAAVVARSQMGTDVSHLNAFRHTRSCGGATRVPLHLRAPMAPSLVPPLAAPTALRAKLPRPRHSSVLQDKTASARWRRPPRPVVHQLRRRRRHPPPSLPMRQPCFPPLDRATRPRCGQLHRQRLRPGAMESQTRLSATMSTA